MNHLHASIKFFFCFLCISATSKAQLNINSATLYIGSGASVTVQGDVASNVDITGPGKLVLNGTGIQEINMNGNSAPTLEVANPTQVKLTGHLKIADQLLFTNGMLSLETFNLTVNSAATIQNFSANRFIITNGSGKLIKSALGNTAFTYPVGFSASTYNPVTLTNSGTIDHIAIRALEKVFQSGTSGTNFTKEVVETGWELTEDVANGSNINMTASWFSADELPGFKRNKAGISYYVTAPANNMGWDLLNAQTAAATGSNPYFVSRNNISQPGIFTVGNRPVLSALLVNPKIFLQGPYVSNDGLMLDGLRTQDLIPTTEPYTGMNSFTHLGAGGLETSTAAVVGSNGASGNNAIVDWVFVQLHNPGNAAVMNTRAALLQRDGDLVETDGVSPLNMAGELPGSYLLSVMHRNHLGIRTSAPIALAKTTSTVYNFTDNQTKAYQNPGVNNPAMILIKAGVFGMYAGDMNFDGYIDGSDYPLFDTDNFNGVSGVYVITDLNGDGFVDSSDYPFFDSNNYNGIVASIP